MRQKIIFLTVLLIFLSAIFIAMYFLNIYEVVVNVTPQELFADNQSEVIIEAYPVNAFGMKIPFRTVNTEFNITSGKELIEVLQLDIVNGKMVLKSRNKTGIVTVLVKPEKALLPSEVTIPIHSNVAAK
jgi:hypothetical protein